MDEGVEQWGRREGVEGCWLSGKEARRGTVGEGNWGKVGRDSWGQEEQVKEGAGREDTLVWGLG